MSKCKLLPLNEPPSAIEISELIVAVQIVPSLNNVARRLALEYDRLKRFEEQDHLIRFAHGWKRDGRELSEIVAAEFQRTVTPRRDE